MLRATFGQRLASRWRTVQQLQQQQNGVTTWSPLATTFNAKPTTRKFNVTHAEAVGFIITRLLCAMMQSSPSLCSTSQGLFNIPELRSSQGFHVLKENVIRHTDQLIAEAIGPQRARKMVSIFDELSDSLCKVADMAEFIRLAHPDAEYAQAATEACITVSGVVEK